MVAWRGTGTPVGRKKSGRSSLRIEPRREGAWVLAPSASSADEGQQGCHHGATYAARRNNAGGQPAPPARGARYPRPGNSDNAARYNRHPGGAHSVSYPSPAATMLRRGECQAAAHEMREASLVEHSHTHRSLLQVNPK